MPTFREAAKQAYADKLADDAADAAATLDAFTQECKDVLSAFIAPSTLEDLALTVYSVNQTYRIAIFGDGDLFLTIGMNDAPPSVQQVLQDGPDWTLLAHPFATFADFGAIL
jgi:hypothetical protein